MQDRTDLDRELFIGRTAAFPRRAEAAKPTLVSDHSGNPSLQTAPPNSPSSASPAAASYTTSRRWAAAPTKQDSLRPAPILPRGGIHGGRRRGGLVRARPEPGARRPLRALRAARYPPLPPLDTHPFPPYRLVRMGACPHLLVESLETFGAFAPICKAPLALVWRSLCVLSTISHDVEHVVRRGES